MYHIHFDNIDVSYPIRVGGRERSTMAALAATASFGRIAGNMKKFPTSMRLEDYLLMLKLVIDSRSLAEMEPVNPHS